MGVSYAGAVRGGAQGWVSGAGGAGLGLLAVALAAAVGLFWNGLGELVDAWSVAEYSHGPLIPLLSALMFLRQMKSVPELRGPVDDRLPGVAAVAFAVLLAVAGILTRIDDFVAYALIVWTGGMVLVSFGWRRGILFWPSVLHLVFMLPLPGLLFWKISTSLQFFSSELGVAFIRAAGVPVFLDGNIIDLGVYKLHVAEACSGLRYLFPVMSFSYIFAHLYQGPVWHKAVLLMLAAPITVFMNSVRIGMVGVIVDLYGIEHAEGLSHFLEGWVIFITCIALLFGLAKLMLVIQRDPRTLAEALDLDLEGVRPQLGRIRNLRPSRALGAAAALTVAAAAAWAAAPARGEAEIRRESLAFFPDRVGGWQVVGTQVLEPGIERVLAADDYHMASLRHEDGSAAELFVAWYADQTAGGIHSPEVCLPGGGWEMAEIERLDLAAAMGSAEPFPVNRAIIQKGTERLMVYYWFEQSDGRTGSDYLAKLSLLRNIVLNGRSDGGLVRLITPLRPGEDEAAADRRLTDLAAAIMPELPRFVPNLSGSSQPVIESHRDPGSASNSG